MFLENKNKHIQKAEAFLKIEGVHLEKIKNDLIPVDSFELNENFCKMYEFKVCLKDNGELINFSNLEKRNLILKKILFEIKLEGIHEKVDKKYLLRKLTGVITDFEFKYIFEEGIKFCYVILKIMPSIYLMNREKKKYIFKDKSIIEICKEILKKNKIKEDSYKFKFINKNINDKKLKFITQYEETDFEFLVRILQENNLYYFIHYDSLGKEHLTIGEDITSIIDTKDDKFEVEDSFPTYKHFKMMMYPVFQNGLTMKNFFSHLKFPTEKIQIMSSSLKKLIFPGKKIVLEGPIDKEFRKKEKKGIDALVLNAYTKFYKNENFQGFLSHEITFHPLNFGISRLKKIDKPKVLSSQIAKVVGAQKEEVVVKKSGMVSICLYWNDKKNKIEILNIPIDVSVTQLFGGVSGDSGYCGSWFMPRIGQKVIVHFLNGDTDFPIITGVIYDEKNVSSYDGKEGGIGSTQLSIKTCSIPNGKFGHELTFEDKSKEEKILLSSSRDFELKTLNDTDFKISKNFSTSVDQGDISCELKKGNKKVTLTEGDYVISLKKGNLEISVMGDIIIKSSQNMKFDATKKMTFKAQDMELAASKSLSINAGSISTSSKSSTQIKSDTSLNLNGKTSASIKGGTSAEVNAMNVSVKADLKLELKGTLGKVEASGPLVIKGAIAQVN